MTLRLQPVNNDIKGRLALVTGSSGGIGSTVARALASEGCDIAIHYSSNKDKADNLAQELSKTYPSQLFVTVKADLSQRESTRSLVPNLLSQDAVSSKHHAVSILVANAGLGRRIRDVSDIREDDWDEMMEINSRSQFVVTKGCIEGMRKQGWGRVILVGSIAARGSGLNGCHYAASKGALSKHKLTIQVSPAMIGSTGMIPPPKSETWDKGCDLEGLKETDPGLAIATSVPIHRLGCPDEVCNVIIIDSTGIPGDPPCRRCIEKHQECVLATSRRGGRRIKGQRLSHHRPSNGSHKTPENGTIRQMDTSSRAHAERSRDTEEPSEWLSSHLGSDSNDEEEEEGRDAVQLQGHFTSSDLLNPSDALDLLAHVADMEPESHNRNQPQEAVRQAEGPGRVAGASQGVCNYPPIESGSLTLSEASFLIEQYHDNFHIFFPIAYSAIFDYTHLLESIEKEQYLITAILTVATKDDPSWSKAHTACARYMESQISKLIYTGSTTVGAVEALLILAEWAPQPLEEDLMIGCGKEDQGSWMLVGVAIRLAYLQNLEQTGLTQRDGDKTEELSRKRIAWAACYMSDRQVSIRLGKGFWSRGPGPSINLRAADFPYLQTQTLGNDNLALLFQAHLEMTQLFSNAHDILYSSTSHREQLYTGGEYVRYIDDFSAVLRRWKLSWGGLSFIPCVKASLMLSYDFLRLYINAFAFQANLNRIVRRQRKRPAGPLFSELAAAPDARFIYESIDAANSILCTINSFIDPVKVFKYMPLKFYLYVIYAAVFLFKAIFAGAIKPSEARGVRRAIYETISRLQKTSDNQQGLGQRYARSLKLLWLKMLGKSRSQAARAEEPSDSIVAINRAAHQGPMDQNQPTPSSDPFNSFSWKDLHSLGEFISNEETSLFNENFIISPEQDSIQGIEGPDHMGGNFFYAGSLGGNDIIF
ncbi:hypothetical protein FGSG_10337 [Fusarium graminearum PH-1]|uniref:hypothetical protein n=1 Tax=Gibberella zeae (strain ATCC MYA-4620 / CBS 123657 / FGSC 9075 / NRRL 31084 / PH-1) TaxID=229533 RepID=UPI000023F6A2|nr:hypothetical protein FGSG_10337 [Fusarium graminearum PH-1]ESU17039.1 hypothetical protein FGSG_10337 [Fusarium graminearum PH-1]|eukprot:XP_011319301.1 hypothetical protein FGSG_10337 [Fusarium graminearum PH-1]